MNAKMVAAEMIGAAAAVIIVEGSHEEESW